MEAMPASVRDTLMRRTSGVGKWCSGRSSQQHDSKGAGPANGSHSNGGPPLAGPSPSWSAQQPVGGVPLAADELSPETADEADGFTYMPLNLAYPGLKLVHKRPPIYVCEDFLSDEECRRLIDLEAEIMNHVQ